MAPDGSGTGFTLPNGQQGFFRITEGIIVATTSATAAAGGRDAQIHGDEREP
jgi:hypothetical protein